MGGATEYSSLFLVTVRSRGCVARVRCEMDRHVFHRSFKVGVGPAVLPVVHVLDSSRNVAIAARGCPGSVSNQPRLPLRAATTNHRKGSGEFPYMWLGVNFLEVSGFKAFPILGELASKGVTVDGYWADNAYIDEHAQLEEQKKATAIRLAREKSNWKGLYFGGTAFKMQRSVAASDVGVAASLASHFMDVITTSGDATGVAANLHKIKAMRASCGNAAMAIASGITPANASKYVDCFLVATGISAPRDFYNFDPNKLRSLVQICRSQSPTISSEK